MNKFLNVKVGVEFYELLMTKPSFKENSMAVSPAYYFVCRIAELNDFNDGKPVEFYSVTIKDIFKHYSDGKGGYARYLEDLKELEILEFSRFYQATTNKKGRCRKYRITDLGCQLLHSGNMEYLKKLRSESKLERKNNKSISNRKVMSKTYDDPVLNYTHEGLRNISFDLDKAEKMIAQSCWSVAQKRNVSSGLRRFAEKKFSELEYKRGRVYHELVTLKSEARPLLVCKGLPYKAVLDIRCCHPNFFSHYIIITYKSIHYVSQKRPQEHSLEMEHQKWIALFSNKAIDPKDTIRISCGFKNNDLAKRAMNESLNGSGRYKKTYLKWMQREFPMLFEIWQETDVKHTGTNITERYEHPLIQDVELYNLATRLGVEIASEHDGVGVFAREDDAELDAKLKILAAHIEASSMRLFSVPVVVRSKPVFNLADCDLLGEMTSKREQYEKQLNQLKSNEDKLRRRCFSTNRDGATWQEYETAKAKTEDLKLRYKDVLEYWSQKEAGRAEGEALRKKFMSPDENNHW